MKLLRLISLSRHHANLCDKVSWYSKWHKHPYHKHVHWLTFSVFVLISGIIVYNSYVLKPSFIQADKDNGKITKNIDKIDISAFAETEALADKEEKKKKEEKEDEKKEKEIIDIEKVAVLISEQAENMDKIAITSDENPIIALLNDEPAPIKEPVIEEPVIIKELMIEEPVIIEEPIIEEPAVVPIIPAVDMATVLDVTSPIRNNKYRTGPMPIYVVFSKPVEVIGSPAFSIATGNPSETLIIYKNGSGTNTLVFSYKIASSNFSSDLDYSSTNSLSLNGGSIKDIDGNDASVVLPAPGSAHSLSANKDIAIDTTLHKPTVL
jgi:hypothetical protein